MDASRDDLTDAEGGASAGRAPAARPSDAARRTESSSAPPDPPDTPDEFCRALALSLDALEVALMLPDPGTGLLIAAGSAAGDGARVTCGRPPGTSGRSPAPPEAGMLGGTALLAGHAVSRFEPAAEPGDGSGDGAGDGPRGILRLAVPVVDPSGPGTLVIETRLRRDSPQPSESDLTIIQTFGNLYSRKIQDGRSRSAPAPARPGNRVGGGGSDHAVGKSSAFTRAQLLAVKAARSEVSVLILGETGTGKELVARRLHDSSRRSRKPFVTINCGALSDATLESEFFGHVRGAFTGAYRSRKGRIQEADGGTVFLDEIGEMTPACQTRLLRTLDTGEIVPMGGNKVTRVDVRFIAATNRDIEGMIQSGRFREDLFYRLQGMRIVLPPLRRRRGDMELLAMHFLAQEAERQENPVREFSPEALAVMREYDWPGNVRELKQAVAGAVAVAEGARIEAGDLPASVRGGRGDVPPGGSAGAPSAHARPGASGAVPTPASEEKCRILAALEETAYPGTGRWNIRAAARRLEMNHQTLRYKIRKVYKLSQ